MEQLPVVRNRSDLETRFYALHQKPSDFVYELLNIHEQLKLDMVEEKLLDHVICRLDSQLLDYVEVRHPQTTSSFLQIINKYEERFLNRMTRGSSHVFRNATHSANNQFPNRNRQKNWRDTRVNNRYSDNSGPPRECNRFRGQGVGWFEERCFKGSEWSRKVFKLLSDRCKSGGDRLQNIANPPDTERRTIRISSLRMTPVDLPHVPIHMNETFITPLWNTGVEKTFISEEIYRIYFSYRPRQKTKDRVVTAKVLSLRLTLDFDKKSLVIPDDQINPLSIVEKPVEIDLSDKKVCERQKPTLQDLFNSFMGLISDQPGLTHVLYHEIDTGDQERASSVKNLSL
ncbi:uncharacterized protein TNCV_3096001 [Trichonephila clavipes]|nr:uncharacterized protein TNCV_3096001 [Trichonephila clavipes]